MGDYLRVHTLMLTLRWQTEIHYKDAVMSFAKYTTPHAAAYYKLIYAVMQMGKNVST